MKYESPTPAISIPIMISAASDKVDIFTPNLQYRNYSTKQVKCQAFSEKLGKLLILLGL